MPRWRWRVHGRGRPPKDRFIRMGLGKLFFAPLDDLGNPLPSLPSPEDELRMLEDYKRELEAELKDLEEELKSVEARIKELKKTLGQEGKG